MTRIRLLHESSSLCSRQTGFGMCMCVKAVTADATDWAAPRFRGRANSYDYLHASSIPPRTSMSMFGASSCSSAREEDAQAATRAVAHKADEVEDLESCFMLALTDLTQLLRVHRTDGTEYIVPTDHRGRARRL